MPSEADNPCTPTPVIKLLLLSLTLYVVLSLFFFSGAYGKNEWIDWTRWTGTFLMAAAFFIGLLLPKKAALAFIFLFQLAVSLLLQETITENTGAWFGFFQTGDGMFYYDYATADSTIPLHEISEVNSAVKWDDYGMFIILRFVRFLTFGHVENFTFVFLLLNAAAVAFSSHLIYEISRFFLFEWYARAALALWGGCIYWSMISAHFLKENFFMALITLSCYYLLKMEDSGKKYTLPFFAALVADGFFRSVYPLMFIFAYLSRGLRKILFSSWFILSFPVFCLLFVFFLVPFFLQHFGDAFGMTLESMRYLNASRGAFISNPYLSSVIVFLASIFGPFCQLTVKENDPSFLYGFYFLLKNLLSFFFLLGLFKLYRSKNRFFPAIFTYFFLSVVIMLLLVVGMDFRYQVTYYPFVLILSLFGLQEMDSIINNKQGRGFVFVGYLCCILMLTCLYNMR